MSEAAAARAALALGKTFDSRAEIEAALDRLEPYYPSHGWSRRYSVQNARAVLLVRCQRNAGRCGVYFRATAPTQPPGSPWSVCYVYYHTDTSRQMTTSCFDNIAQVHAAFLYAPTPSVTAKRARVDEHNAHVSAPVEQRERLTGGSTGSVPLQAGAVVLSSAADWSGWPSQVRS